MFGRVWNMISAMEIYVCDKKAEIDRQMKDRYKRIKASEGEKNDKNSVENSRRHFAESVSRPETAQIICRMQSGCVCIPA